MSAGALVSQWNLPVLDMVATAGYPLYDCDSPPGARWSNQGCSNLFGNTVNVEQTFSLSGYHLSSVKVTIEWSQDNTADLYMNDNQVGSAPDNRDLNTITITQYFNQGDNTIKLSVRNSSGPGYFLVQSILVEARPCASGCIG